MKVPPLKIKEIFESLQGEGPFTGQKHLFIRLVGCNLNCAYCDTNHIEDDKISVLSPSELFEKIKKSTAKTISFTGGEPLLQSFSLCNFLKEYKQPLKKTIYLETNGTLPNRLREVIDCVDVVAMDIKLKSATGEPNCFNINDEFLLVARDKDVFIKVVFDANITDKEIDEVTTLAKKHGVEIILQPKMPIDRSLNAALIFEKFYKKCSDVRLIPQVHKFLHLP